MIILGGQNSVGSVIHLITGPESELYMDLHGANIVDITPLLAALVGYSGERKLFISLTRCGDELSTMEALSEVQIPCASTGLHKGQAEKPVKDETENPPVAPTGATPKKDSGIGRCRYCGTPNKKLLPIPGFHICESCAQIELGRNKERSSIDSGVKE